MKKHFYFFALFVLPLITEAQQIQNSDFDSVYIGGIDRIFDWITSDAWPTLQGDTVPPLNTSDHYVSPGLQYHETYHTVQLEYSGAFHGQFAIKVLSDSGVVQNNGIPFKGFIINGDHFYTDTNGYIDLKKGGTPFVYRPIKLKGHFKFVDSSPSLNVYGKAIVLLKKFNTSTQQSDTVGFAESTTQLFPTTTWSPFELTINYLNSNTPDTLMVAFLSPGTGFSSTLWIDSLGFEYTATSGLTDLGSSSGFSIYPNPVKGTLHIDPVSMDIPDGTTIQLLNMSGQTVYSSALFRQNLVIELPHLISGIYILQLNTGTEFFQKKIVVWN